MQKSCSSDIVESVIISLSEELLDVKGILRTDDFLSFGGASVTAVRLVIQLEERFDIEIPLSYIFDFRTIGELASEIVKHIDNDVLLEA